MVLEREIDKPRPKTGPKENSFYLPRTSFKISAADRLKFRAFGNITPSKKAEKQEE